MKILTWNLQRLEKNKNRAILDILAEVNADILILTETNSIINPGTNYTSVSTKPLPNNFDCILYKPGENRVTIWTKYKVTTIYNTSDHFTSVCSEIETPLGLLTVYGTIIGVFGGKGKRFNDDLKEQLADFEKLFPGKQVCIAGDFNVAFSGYPYPSHAARQTLKESFSSLSLTNTTSDIVDSVDHIVLSTAFIKDRQTIISIWNTDKKLSDHIGVCLTIQE